jgi:hypothetical protein
MTIRRQKAWTTLLISAVVILGLGLALEAESPAQSPFKLEGAWVARVISLKGVPGPYPFQWSYILAPDASGRSASIHASIDVGFPPDPLLPHDFSSPIIGEIIQTGPDTAEFNSYWYGIKKDVINKIVYIGRVHGKITCLEPGLLEVEHNFQIFLPGADLNGDGFPEGMPVKEFKAVTRDTRIPSAE